MGSKIYKRIKGSSVSRTTVPVESEVAKEASSVAKAQGYSVVKLASDALKLAVELLRRGITPGKAIEMFRLLEKALAFDVVPVPLSYLELVAKKWKTCEDEEVIAFLKETGAKFGKIAVQDFRSFGEFMAVASQFFSLLPVSRLSFSRSGNTWRIVFAATGEMSVKCLGYFAEEAIRQFGCTVKTTYESNVIVAEVSC
ncbi:MAG: hypothetical protein QXJ71_10120 [Pyrobaculum sp.]|uniref:hypothetical protein n=1 Tax=Pyrobaculum sp. TaxID=2004705 RepID=UPI00315F8AAE